jgi:hypothetical protein
LAMLMVVAGRFVLQPCDKVAAFWPIHQSLWQLHKNHSLWCLNTRTLLREGGDNRVAISSIQMKSTFDAGDEAETSFEWDATAPGIAIGETNMGLSGPQISQFHMGHEQAQSRSSPFLSFRTPLHIDNVGMLSPRILAPVMSSHLDTMKQDERWLLGSGFGFDLDWRLSCAGYPCQNMLLSTAFAERRTRHCATRISSGHALWTADRSSLGTAGWSSTASLRWLHERRSSHGGGWGGVSSPNSIWRRNYWAPRAVLTGLALEVQGIQYPGSSEETVEGISIPAARAAGDFPSVVNVSRRSAWRRASTA